MLSLALVLAALLNADGLHKGATNREDGVGRDVAMALTGPLQDVSHALRLDRPRRWLKAAVGREEDDTIDTAIVAPPSETGSAMPPRPGPRPRDGVQAGAKPAPRPARAAPKRRVFGPSAPLRLWIAGDSLGEVPGLAIVRQTGANRALAAVGDKVRTRIGTGLGRPDVYNWFREIGEAVRDYRPHVVILALGGNDFHAYMSGIPDGVEIGPFLSPSWKREYRRRVGILLDTVTRLGADVVWIGLPKPSSPNMRPRFTALNALIRAEVDERPRRVTFLDTYAILAGKRGRFAEYLPDGAGRLEKVRAGDGLHLAPAGGTRVARALVAALAARYDIESWRTQRQ